IQMADVNVNAPAEQAPAMAPPTRTDDQILPRSRWVAVGKSNCYLDVERSQSNPIYKIAVDILKQTNFFRAFIASSTIPSIYIQQFWDTVRYDKTTGNYSCQLDEQWFDLTKDTLRDALQITPVDNNNAFTSPPTPDALIKFVNDLGYPKVVRTLSDVVTNDMFQPWRALTTIINLCLTGKTSGFERPRAPMLQILWGKVAKHQRYLAVEEVSDPDSPAPKLNKATKHKATKKSKPSAPKASPVIKPAVFKASKSQQTKSAPAKPQEKKRKLLIDKFIDEGVPENEPRLDDEEAATQRAIEESIKEVHDTYRGPLPPVVIREPDSGKFHPLPKTQKKKSPTKQYIFQRSTSTPTESFGHDESSSLYVELGLTVSETESDEEVPGIVTRVQDEGQDIPNPYEHDEGQAGPNPGDAATSQPPSSHVVHA
ncbi:hypothetical protein Tco_0632640, partial [Tanacetum coccineum]